MGESRHCPVCRTVLPDSAPGGFCPLCEFRGALEAPKDASDRLADSEPVVGAEGWEPLAPERTPSEISEDAALGVQNRGRCLGDYELLEEIARGGMGVVYRARQRGLDRTVAVKLLRFGPHASPEQVKRFRAEATSAASLQHPNIVAIHEVGVHRGEHYLVMDLVDGPNLASFVKDRPLPPRRAAAYLQTVAEAIQYAHERGILHRDLKPSNVLIDANDQPRVTDFGLAKRMEADSSLTVSGQLVGSPSYMPPEQAGTGHGRVGRRSDVYALGAMLYHMLVGRPPFVGEGLNQTLDQVFHREPVSPRLLNPAVARDLETICLKCLEKEPARRYPNARALADELGRFLCDEPIHARPVSPPEKLWRWCRRKPGMAVLILLMHLVGAVGLGGILWQWRRAEHEQVRARWSVYVADVRSANEATEANNFVRAGALLDRAVASREQRRNAGWEWRHLWERVRGGETNLLGRHEAKVSAAAISPNGQWAATLSDDGMVKLWDYATGEEADAWPAHSPTSNPESQYPGMAVAFAPDSRTFATGGRDGLVRVWDVGPPHSTITLDPPLGGNCTDLAFSTQGSLLVAERLNGELTVWSLSNSPPRLLGRWPTGIVQGWSLALSADGKLLAAAGFRGPVQLWDISDPQTPRLLRVFEDTVRPLALSPDGRWLVAADASKERLRQWDLLTGEEQRRWPERRGSFVRLAFSPDGRMLASTASDGSLVRWDLDNVSNPVALGGHEDYVPGLAFSPDGRSLLSASFDRTVRRWETSLAPRDKRVLEHQQSAVGVCFTPDSRYLASVGVTNPPRTNGVSGERHTVKLWELAGLTEVTNVTGSGTAWNSYCVFSPDGSLLAVESRKPQRVQLFRMPTLEPMTDLAGLAPAFAAKADSLFHLSGRSILRRDSPASTNAVTTVIGEFSTDLWTLMVSPDGRTLAYTSKADQGRSIHFWDVNRRRPLGIASGHEAVIIVLAFSPDNRWLASVSWDGTVGVCDVRARRLVTRLRGHTGELQALAFSPDGLTFASGGQDGFVRLWSLSALEEVAALHCGGGIFGVRFSPDGQWLAAATMNGKVHVWHAPLWAEIEVAATRPGPGGHAPRP